MTGANVDPDAFNAFEAAGWESQVAGYRVGAELELRVSVKLASARKPG